MAFEPGLVETLLDTVQSQPGGLPLLQFAMRGDVGPSGGKNHAQELCRDRRLSGALAQRAERCLPDDGARP